MQVRISLVIGIISTLAVLHGISADTPRVMSVWVSCDGTIIERTDVGKLQVSHGPLNQS